jgi:hypothetical protein
LFANIGHGQVRDDDADERPIITSGDELACLGAFFRERQRYSAGDVIEHLLSFHVASNGHAASNGHGSLNGNGNGHGSLNGNGHRVVTPAELASLNGHHANGNGSSNGNGAADPSQVHSRVIA